MTLLTPQLILFSFHGLEPILVLLTEDGSKMHQVSVLLLCEVYTELLQLNVNHVFMQFFSICHWASLPQVHFKVHVVEDCEYVRMASFRLVTELHGREVLQTHLPQLHVVELVVGSMLTLILNAVDAQVTEVPHPALSRTVIREWNYEGWTGDFHLYERLSLDKLNFGLATILHLFELFQSGTFHDFVNTAEGEQLAKLFEVDASIDTYQFVHSNNGLDILDVFGQTFLVGQLQEVLAFLAQLHAPQHIHTLHVLVFEVVHVQLY